MNQSKLEGMSINELWIMHEKIRAILLTELERRLAQLNGHSDKQRRPYPKVLPKFQNPARPSETWAGRGKQPRWLTAQLRSGNRIDDFRIRHTH